MGAGFVLKQPVSPDSHNSESPCLAFKVRLRLPLVAPCLFVFVHIIGSRAIFDVKDNENLESRPPPPYDIISLPQKALAHTGTLLVPPE